MAVRCGKCGDNMSDTDDMSPVDCTLCDSYRLMRWKLRNQKPLIIKRVEGTWEGGLSSITVVQETNPYQLRLFKE